MVGSLTNAVNSCGLDISSGLSELPPVATPRLGPLALVVNGAGLEARDDVDPEAFFDGVAPGVLPPTLRG